MYSSVTSVNLIFANAERTCNFAIIRPLQKFMVSCLHFMLTWSNVSDVSYCNHTAKLIVDKKTDRCDLYAYHEAISMITLPLTPHLFLPKIAINYWGIPPRFRQATTITVGHDRDCCTPCEYSCKQPYLK